MAKEQSPVWWEKTVEYTYLSLMPRGHVIAPLAGKFEAGGDAMLRWDEYNWFLVEFKRDQSGFGTENDKFPRYEDRLNDHALLLLEDIANTRAVGYAEPHYLVYATHVKSGKLNLEACRYWGPWCRQEIFAIAAAPIQNLQEQPILMGAERSVFNQYLSMLLAAKSNGTGSVSSGAFGVVMGIAKVGDEIVSLSMDDYVQEHGLALINAPVEAQQNTYSPPSPGMG